MRDIINFAWFLGGLFGGKNGNEVSYDKRA